MNLANIASAKSSDTPVWAIEYVEVQDFRKKHVHNLTIWDYKVNHDNTISVTFRIDGEGADDDFFTTPNTYVFATKEDAGTAVVGQLENFSDALQGYIDEIKELCGLTT